MQFYIAGSYDKILEYGEGVPCDVPNVERINKCSFSISQILYVTKFPHTHTKL